MSRLILGKSRAFDWLKIIRCKSQASNPKNEGIQATDGQSESQKLNTLENNVSSDLTANPEKILYPEKFKEKITPYKEHFHLCRSTSVHFWGTHGLRTPIHEFKSTSSGSMSYMAKIVLFLGSLIILPVWILGGLHLSFIPGTPIYLFLFIKYFN